ncbi:uroporphyrinogen decarboxylase [Spirochaetia bacterium]|nr:uroporphyrinogen decarboxylase [Spirochaetia bacterium]
MNQRERVHTAISHKQPDRTPVDIQAVPEIWEALFRHFTTDSMKTVMETLQIDCAWADPEVLRMPDKKDTDGLIIGWGGSKGKMVKNDFGEYLEIVHYATDACNTPGEMDAALDLPDLKTADFSSAADACKMYGDYFLIGGFASSFYYPTLVRRMEDILIDMIDRPELIHHLIKRCFDWHMEYHERLLKACGGRLDAMQIADDFATQIGPLMSLDMFREFFKNPIAEYIALAKSYGAIPYMHCCGSAYHFIGEFIEMGIRILDPVQTAAANMAPEKLKREFGEKITFHGGGETQHILPHGTAEDARKNAQLLSKTMGENGGYILEPSHQIQADVPIENVLAFYEIENRLTK